MLIQWQCCCDESIYIIIWNPKQRKTLNNEILCMQYNLNTLIIKKFLGNFSFISIFSTMEEKLWWSDHGVSGVQNYNFLNIYMLNEL